MDITAIGGVNNTLATAGAPAGFTSAPSPVQEDRHALIQAVHAVNAAEMYGPENELSFAFDRKTRHAIVRIVDRKTREVVQQIPSEQVLKLAEELQQRA
jgi:flagellar protein FlaG